MSNGASPYQLPIKKVIVEYKPKTVLQTIAKAGISADTRNHLCVCNNQSKTTGTIDLP